MTRNSKNLLVPALLIIDCLLINSIVFFFKDRMTDFYKGFFIGIAVAFLVAAIVCYVLIILKRSKS